MPAMVGSPPLCLPFRPCRVATAACFCGRLRWRSSWCIATTLKPLQRPSRPWRRAGAATTSRRRRRSTLRGHGLCSLPALIRWPASVAPAARAAEAPPATSSGHAALRAAAAESVATSAAAAAVSGAAAAAEAEAVAPRQGSASGAAAAAAVAAAACTAERPWLTGRARGLCPMQQRRRCPWRHGRCALPPCCAASLAGPRSGP